MNGGPAPAPRATGTPRQRRPTRWFAGALAALGVALIAAVVVSFVSTGDGTSRTRLALDDIPDGVSVWRPATGPAGFLVRSGDAVELLVASSPHQGGPLAWCEETGVFVDLLHGSLFDGRGYKIAGPSPRGLDRLPVTVADGDVRIDPSSVELGPPLDQPGDMPARVAGAWQCDDFLHAR